MKYLSFITLMLTFLLNGCFSGKEYPSGLLHRSELRQSREEQRMKELNQSKILRLGVTSSDRDVPDEIRKKLESDGWKIKVIICPDNRLTGLLRTGAVDLIYRPGFTKDDAEKWNLIYFAPDILGNNQYLLMTKP